MSSFSSKGKNTTQKNFNYVIQSQVRSRSHFFPTYDVDIERFIEILNRLVDKKRAIFFVSVKKLEKNPVSLVFIKSIQQFALIIQKKRFTRKLWAFYKIKTFSESLYESFWPTPKVSITPLVSFYGRDVTPKVSLTPLIIYSGQYLKESVEVDLNLCESGPHPKASFTPLNTFERNKQSQKLLSYIISENSEFAAKSIVKYINKIAKKLLEFSFKKIENLKNFERKKDSAGSIYSFLLKSKQKLKKTSFFDLKNYLKKSIKYKNFLFLSDKIHFLLKIKLTYSFYQIKIFSAKENFFSRKIQSILENNFFLAKQEAFEKIYRFSTSVKIKESPPKKTTKLVTLRTYFLEGDPGPMIACENIKYHTNLRSNSSFSKGGFY